ncbi:hypothetical protein CQ019_05965 [Arthrobacter sp. MYb229]|uniref:HNH endonuclease signature motif containing protein n=1 Tax=unclassified Arthrobacter TaxID=235627 RepID=UPI000CFD772D|nr:MULTISPECIES: HNH endonuclease signature motif containing protein [unclassified Arthrobacter]PRA06894.1 hypothetical protein CQ019_05965 [Arthrobacter sp. MYb229]PRB47842.1 hypothetical protein CQ013_15760 [Arthrobacter sp. MYb216]
MSISQLAAGLTGLREFVTGSIPQGAIAVLLEVMELCLEVLQKLSVRLRESTDPRVAAAHALCIENIFRYAVREQLRAAAHCEGTGAHLLAEEELSAVRDHRADYSRPARQESGRTPYRNAAGFTAGWLGLDFHEADRRINDAHLLVARRNMDGSALSPRFAELATLHSGHESLDPRRVAKTARSLEQLEPADTSFEGAPLDPVATHRDGRPMQAHAVKLLTEEDRATGEKKFTDLLAGYRKAHAQATEPECGFFSRGTRNGVDTYLVRVKGAQAEQFRSFVGQADNPRTRSGQAARAANPPEPAPETLFDSDRPAPAWAQIPAEHEASAPESAGNPTPGPEAPTGAADHAAEADQVTVAQRRLNALLASLTHSAPGAKTVTPQILVNMQAQNLEDLAQAKGLTAHGVELDPGELRQLLCDAQIIPIVFGGNGQVLDVGRSQRLFPEPIKRAAFARDRGCIVPGCTAPHEMLEYHHCNWWERGGKTCVENCAVLCRQHHTAIHRRLLRIAMVDSLPHILLPKYLDPAQIPRRNSYFSAVA